jgi:hypothetical protein
MQPTRLTRSDFAGCPLLQGCTAWEKSFHLAGERLMRNPFGGEVVPSPSPVILFALLRTLVLAFFSLAFLPQLEAWTLTPPRPDALSATLLTVYNAIGIRYYGTKHQTTVVHTWACHDTTPPPSTAGALE